MLKKIFATFVFVTVVLLLQSCTTSVQLTTEQKLTAFFQKDKVNIIVTDSGLGGVSVAADVYERLKNSRLFSAANVLFFNAQPHIKSGYNSMKTDEQKITVFDNALEAMQKNFAPDIILIACNTLSVLYPQTRFSQQTEIPVVGIVETGVDLIKQNLDNEKNGDVFIFATKTTVEQETHKRMLVEQGVNDAQIYTKACPKLAGAIERGSHDAESKELIQQYVQEAVQDYEKSDKLVFVSFNCTHYGYVGDIFEEEFRRQGFTNIHLLDPNPLMADFIFRQNRARKYDATQVTTRIISQPELTPDKLASISLLIAKSSQETSDAMLEYEFTPDLFEWRSITGDKNE